jgi:hypothetical protein
VLTRESFVFFHFYVFIEMHFSQNMRITLRFTYVYALYILSDGWKIYGFDTIFLLLHRVVCHASKAHRRRVRNEANEKYK